MDVSLTIAWVPSGSPTQHRLHRLLPRDARLRAFGDDVALIDAITRGDISATVVEAGGSTHDLALRVLHFVARAFPQHPRLAWCDLRSIGATQLLEIAAAGTHGMLRAYADESRRAVADALATATQRAVGPRIIEVIGEVVPQRVRPVMEFAIEHANSHLDRTAVARTFGLSRRSLHTRLATYHLPPTREFLTWARVLVACALLDQPGHSVESVAVRLGFSDGGVLRKILMRYTGLTATRLRELGALRTAARAFQDDVSARQRGELPVASAAD
jgi:AraC-like DNA-binding protein